ncbi:MAG: hypothetical protein KIT79_11390 [Deltaproteobacteria bacterium]|nr:hypothetical protein [Deltaproteobacteria bacterium]
MLFRQRFLDGIATGQVTLAFRRWEKPAVTPGRTQRTPAGVLEFLAVDLMALAAITDREAKQAGYKTLDELRQELAAGREGKIYRIRFHLAGPDPRIALRKRTSMTAAERKVIDGKLARLDAASRHGPWTRRVLDLIRRNRGVRAVELAARIGGEADKFKLDVRKLKELGLTKSLGTGYGLSPRGRAYLKRK